MKRIAGIAAASALTIGALATAAAPASASTSTSVAKPAAASPSTNAAAPTTYRVTGKACYSNQIRFSARQQENGYSGVTQFRQVAREQEYTGRGWVNYTGNYQYTSNRFPNNGASYYYALNWHFNHVANGASFRVLWQGFYFSGSRVAYRTPVIAVTCF